MTRLYSFQTRPVECVICGGIVDEPVDVMDAFRAAPDVLSEAFESKPPGTGAGWSPIEVAVHLADLEVSRGWRFRRILSEEEPALEVVDQVQLAAALHYEKRDLVLALEVFWVIRRANVELLTVAGDSGLARSYRHPLFGRMTLESLVEHTTHHDLAHLRQIVGS